MFGKSTRFSGPGSYLKEDVENSASRGNRSPLPGKTPSKKKPDVPRLATRTPREKGKSTDAPTRNVYSARRERGDGDLPSYMQATHASSARKTTGTKGETGRLKFATAQGADTLGPTVDFGREARGMTPMKKGKHGRFSIADSYFTIEQADKIDHVGLGHGDDKAVKKGHGNGGVVAMKTDVTERFGKGSYLESCTEGKKMEFLIGHEEFASDSGTKGTSAFMDKSGSDRSDWVRKDTVLQDKELAACAGISLLPDRRGGNFDEDTIDDSQGTSIFQDSTERFKDIELDPGSSNLGPELTDASAWKAKGGPVYKKKAGAKHTRLSEFGTMLTTPSAENDTRRRHIDPVAQQQAL
mmetsp:Transcript_4453/g.6660  ORF Transcript_4453/g.6660 Transcript_4453/m.6660 type:complete len:354 (+) Transcript_4453:169-1230(+)|eukprot:CAMPEP_0203749606 /NCGR_PEP_ID=MMETSP0098-20131031/4100_1 /ASSEMBLY_ACC=CAM_ASM_000208 /TAXON_ID=96639 /ORGANISM=" , Strain NY0313808BC1" /LENGTH=353 /DNA_ID=CAMNT_0050638685 /DNA_START=188 /DNA_END=1249 /DNA_ORIENTATION=-